MAWKYAITYYEMDGTERVPLSGVDVRLLRSGEGWELGRQLTESLAGSGHYEIEFESESDCGAYEVWDDRTSESGSFSGKTCIVGKLDSRGIQNDAVDTTQIADGAVTEAKLSSPMAQIAAMLPVIGINDNTIISDTGRVNVDPGDGTDCSGPHALVLAATRIIMGVRSKNATKGGFIVRYNDLDDLSDNEVFRLDGTILDPPHYPQVDDAVYDPFTGMVYMIVGGATQSKLIEIDPNAATWDEATAVTVLYEWTSSGDLNALAIDDNSAYLCAAGGEYIYIFDLLAHTPGQVLAEPIELGPSDYGSSAAPGDILFHSLAIKAGKLYAIDSYTVEAWILKIDLATAVVEKAVNMPEGWNRFTDDCAIAGQYLYAGTEGGTGPDDFASWGLVLRFDTDDLSYIPIYTGIVGKIMGGIRYDGSHLWIMTSESDPPALYALDPKSLVTKKHVLADLVYPLNELVFANGKIYMTAWTYSATPALNTELVQITNPFADFAAIAQTIEILDHNGVLHSLSFNLEGALSAYSASSPIYAQGSGSSRDPYIVDTPTRLNAVRYNLAAHYKQAANIDLTEYQHGEGWAPIGNIDDHFSGSYDGDGYAITGLVISSEHSEFVGLFAYVDAALIKNLTLTSVDVEAGDRVGGLAGIVYGAAQINNCHVTGSVTALDGSAGGIAGLLGEASEISQCSVDADVVATSFCGGIVAYLGLGSISQCLALGSVVTTGAYAGGIYGNRLAASIVTDCYAQADVTGDDKVGGLGGVTTLNCVTSYCYATGSVTGSTNTGGFFGYKNISNGTNTSNFWDETTSGLENAIAGEIGDITGVTGGDTATLKTDTTYAAWDTDIWLIVNGYYPTLQWETP